MPDPARSACKYRLVGTASMVDHRVEVTGDGHLIRRYEDPQRPDRTKHLSPLRQRLLDVLVAYADRSFKSEELAATLQEHFPDQGAVAPNAIAVHISHLRNALGDEARDSGFIKTESGAYQLCADIEKVDFTWPPTGEAATANAPAVSSEPPEADASAALDDGGTAQTPQVSTLLGPDASLPVSVTVAADTVPASEAPWSYFWNRNRRLVFLAGAFAIIVPLLLLIVRQPFKVGTGNIDHNGDPLLQTYVKKLPERLRTAINAVPPWRLYGFSNSPLDRPIRLEGSLERENDRLRFKGTLRGLDSGCQPTLRQEDAETASDKLVDKLADDVALQLDWEACFHKLRLSPWDSLELNTRRRALHCLRAGRTLRQDLRYCQAKEALVMAYEHDPQLHEAVNLLASVYENQGNDEAAVSLLKSLLQQTEQDGGLPKSIRGRYERRLAGLEGQVGRAIKQLKELAREERELNEHRPQEEVSWSLSNALSWSYRVHEQDCERALEDLPEDHGNAALEADFWLACGNSEKAIELYRERYEQESDSGALYPLAHGLRLGGYAPMARRYLEQILEETPNYHAAHLELVQLLTEQGCRDDAKLQADKLMKHLKPAATSDQTITDVGEMRCLVDDADRSCRPLVLERDAYIARALLIEIGAVDYEAALADAKAAQFAREDSKRPFRWSMRAAWAEGLVHLAAGEIERVPEVEAVLEQIKDARQQGGSLWEGHLLHHLRGRRLLAQGKASDAADEFRTVLDDYDVEEHAFFLTELATALAAAGQVDEARGEIGKAREFDPRFRAAECLLAELNGGSPERASCEQRANPVCTAG